MTLTLNGNPTSTLPIGAVFIDLGAALTRDGQTETITSTTTLDTSVAGTTTLDYWAHVISPDAWLHASRAVIITSPPLITPAANDNQPASTSTITSSSPTHSASSTTN